MSMFRLLRHRAVSLLKMSSSKNITTTSKSYDKALEELQNNPFYNKYASKISVMQQFEPEEFEAKLNTFAEKQKKPLKEAKERPYSTATPGGKPKLVADPFIKPKKLDDIMKTDLLIDKSADEIKELWLNYHKDKDVITGVIPEDTYSKFHKRGDEFSTFILPVPRSQGYEFILCQFAGHEVHFTPLIAYQTHKENAPECLTMTHYPDLVKEKGIVLMKGEYNTDILNCQEAQCLANELQLYYAQDNEERLNLLKKFTYTPNEFKHMDLITELETLSL